MGAGLRWGRVLSSTQGQAQQRHWENTAGGAGLCILFNSGHRSSKELWFLLIPGGTTPAATWLGPGHRDSGRTLGGADPQQREGRRAIKSLIKGRQLPKGGNEGD